MAKLTPEQRETLHQQVKAFDEAIGRIDRAMEPLHDARMAVEEAKDVFLESHDAVIAGHCEEGCLILDGEKGHTGIDGPTWCEEHAPTWRDIKEHFEAAPESFDDPADDEEQAAAARESLRANLAAREAAGTLDEKHVWVL